MRGDLTIRKTRTASGATAVQVVRYESRCCIVVKHMGSAHDDDSPSLLLADATRHAEQHRVQPSLFAEADAASKLVDLSKVQLLAVTHTYARKALLACARLCGLKALPILYRDQALMRIVEPDSNLHTIELARDELKDSLSLVLYDVTTLYFESFIKRLTSGIGKPPTKPILSDSVMPSAIMPVM